MQSIHVVFIKTKKVQYIDPCSARFLYRKQKTYKNLEISLITYGFHTTTLEQSYYLLNSCVLQKSKFVSLYHNYKAVQ